MRRAAFVALAVLAVLEIGTLAVLLINLAAGHDPVIARVIGPVHGAIYLSVAMLALLSPGLRWKSRLFGLVPVIGGVLAVARARSSQRE